MDSSPTNEEESVSAETLKPIYPYTVGIRGMNYVIVDTRNGQVQVR